MGKRSGGIIIMGGIKKMMFCKKCGRIIIQEFENEWFLCLGCLEHDFVVKRYLQEKRFNSF